MITTPTIGYLSTDRGLVRAVRGMSGGRQCTCNDASSGRIACSRTAGYEGRVALACVGDPWMLKVEGARCRLRMRGERDEDAQLLRLSGEAGGDGANTRA